MTVKQVLTLTAVLAGLGLAPVAIAQCSQASCGPPPPPEALLCAKQACSVPAIDRDAVNREMARALTESRVTERAVLAPLWGSFSSNACSSLAANARAANRRDMLVGLERVCPSLTQ